MNNMNIKKALMGLGIIFVAIIIFILMLKNLFKNKNVSTNIDEMKAAGSYEASKQAFEDVVKESEAGIVKTNDLTCNASEVVDYEIIVVECITQSEKIIDHFKAKNIYYAYKKSNDGYINFISNNKKDVLKGIKESIEKSKANE